MGHNILKHQKHADQKLFLSNQPTTLNKVKGLLSDVKYIDQRPLFPSVSRIAFTNPTNNKLWEVIIQQGKYGTQKEISNKKIMYQVYGVAYFFTTWGKKDSSGHSISKKEVET